MFPYNERPGSVVLYLLSLFLAAVLALGTNWGESSTASGGVAAAFTAAKQADSFVDTFGVNVHLTYTATPYVKNFPLIQQSLISLGVRHIRDGLIDTTWQPYYDHLNQLGTRGVKADLVTDVGQTAQLLTSYPARVSQAIESYEAPNEYDNRGVSNWASNLRKFQQLLYTTVKGNQATAKYPVLGPSLTSPDAFAAAGDLAAYMDSGNLHNYFGGHHPGTSGWGDGGYGSIPWNTKLAKVVDGTKSLYTTETGYYTILTQQGIPKAIEGRYAPRVLLEQFNAGILRTYFYELIDEASNTTNPEANYGLLRYDGSPKPAFTALQNVISLLKDPGPQFAPGGLIYRLSGSTENVHQCLLQKRDGSLYLLLWLEVSSYDPNAQRAIAITPQSVGIHLGQATGTPVVYTLDDNGNMSQATHTLLNGTLMLSIADRVTVVALPPPGR